MDAQHSIVRIAFFLALLIALILFPTGILTGNEEYYFQLAAQLWSNGVQSQYAAIQEKSYHLFLSAFTIGLPVKWLGYESANVVLRICAVLALAGSFAYLASIWRLSALDAVLSVSVFFLLGQEFFGGEWIFQSMESKVFAYIFIFLGLAQAFKQKWMSCVLAVTVATYFHFLVGGFWTLVALVWLLLCQLPPKVVLRALFVYVLAILPLAALIYWQRIESNSVETMGDTWHAFAVMRMPHHIAPFSSNKLIWNWTPGIVFLLGTLMASILALKLDLEQKSRNLIWLIVGLQTYLCVALLTSATETGVRVLGKFFLFRPSSLTLLLMITAIFIVIRQRVNCRMPVWIAAWILIPLAGWSAIKSKVEEVAWNPVESTEMNAMIEAATRSTNAPEIVLIQPGRDGDRPEVTLSRLLQRPTLVNWKFAPTVPSHIATWMERQQFRRNLFADGCKEYSEYPIGALIVRNQEMPVKNVIDSCGEIVWRGPNYSVIDVR